jgi:hypothetical protein
MNFKKRVQELQIFRSEPTQDPHVQHETQLQFATQMAHRHLLICNLTLIKREPLTRAQWYCLGSDSVTGLYGTVVTVWGQTVSPVCMAQW